MEKASRAVDEVLSEAEDKMSEAMDGDLPRAVDGAFSGVADELSGDASPEEAPKPRRGRKRLVGLLALAAVAAAFVAVKARSSKQDEDLFPEPATNTRL
jgi:hypothetical protein